MQAIILKQKPAHRPKRRRKANCYNCSNSSRYDESFSYEYPPGQVRCRVWKCVVGVSYARWCPKYEPDKPVKRKGRKRW